MAASNVRTTPLPLQCKECGSSFERLGRMAREYCSEECRLSRKRRLRNKGVPPLCERCGEEFVRNSNRQKFCMPCREGARDDYNKQYYCENIDDIREVRKEDAARLRKENPERVREIGRKWQAAHWDQILAARRTPEEREKARIRQAKQRARDPRMSINARIRSRIYESLREKKAGRAWETLVGYTLDDLMRHLERQFLPGMSWSNRGEWHIDHILPLASFNITNEVDDEFMAAWAITNLRPLWAHDNKSKGAKVLTLV